MIEYTFEVVDVVVVKDFIEKHHYSKSINGVKVSKCFAAFDKDRNLIGAILYGQLSTTAWKRYGENESEVIELRRMVSVCKYPNFLSNFCSKTIRWFRKNTDVKIIVSYADPYYGHKGYIYQSLNFQYVGDTNPDTILVDCETGKRYHSRSLRVKYKGDYKPFVKILREKHERGLLISESTPPKHIYIYNLRNSIRSKNNYPK